MRTSLSIFIERSSVFTIAFKPKKRKEICQLGRFSNDRSKAKKRVIIWTNQKRHDMAILQWTNESSMLINEAGRGSVVL